MPAPVLVTRPAPEAQHWVAQLQAQGLTAQALPLIAIGPSPRHQAAVQQARAQLAQYQAVMFVSGNAAHYFFEPNSALALDWQAQAAINTRAWTPGPGTARVLHACGVPAACIDGPAADATQFDSEALWQRVHPQVRAGMRVLIVRGTTAGADSALGLGRDWLAQQLRQAGAQVDFVVAYERAAPCLSAAEQRLAQAGAHDGSLWLFSSSEAVGHLRQLLPGQGWQHARALTTHPRIAQAAHAAGFGQVHHCKPALEAVVASIKSLP